ncbi:MAG: hypothetical protein GY702_15375 [Desulfobulbaceae bacterium]|nr:hypothetical protein [Desulfobulbaceae bacterium]
MNHIASLTGFTAQDQDGFGRPRTSLIHGAGRPRTSLIEVRADLELL